MTVNDFVQVILLICRFWEVSTRWFLNEHSFPLSVSASEETSPCRSMLSFQRKSIVFVVLCRNVNFPKVLQKSIGIPFIAGRFIHNFPVFFALQRKQQENIAITHAQKVWKPRFPNYGGSIWNFVLAYKSSADSYRYHYLVTDLNDCNYLSESSRQFSNLTCFINRKLYLRKIWHTSGAIMRV